MDYQELRSGLGKDAAKVLFALFIGLPLTLFAFLTLSDYMGAGFSFLTIVVFFIAVAAYRRDRIRE